MTLAKESARVGCDGLMVLPPYVYRGDWRETEAHFSSVLDATTLSCMLYNNPIAYGTDLSAEQIGELAHKHRNVHAVKESSGDVRRLTAVRALLGNRLALFAGLDDMILEAVALGADGWVAGLVNALPTESVTLVDLGQGGEDGGGAPALRLVPAAPPVRHGAQVRAADQAGAGGGGDGYGDGARPATSALAVEREEALKVVRKRLAHRVDV